MPQVYHSQSGTDTATPSHAGAPDRREERRRAIAVDARARIDRGPNPLAGLSREDIKASVCSSQPELIGRGPRRAERR